MEWFRLKRPCLMAMDLSTLPDNAKIAHQVEMPGTPTGALVRRVGVSIG
jgi:hypothetical protein